MYIEITFLFLTIISLLTLVAGVVLLLVRSGSIKRRGGENVGADMMADQMEEEWETGIASRSVFKGQAREVSVGVSVTFSEIKSTAASGNWREALPALLAIGGLVGFLSFGSLTLFVIMEDKLVGGIILAVVVIAVARILVRFARA